MENNLPTNQTTTETDDDFDIPDDFDITLEELEDWLASNGL